VVYGSELIDLSGVDLAALNELPSAALQRAITRVRDELSGDGDRSAIYAGFRSSLPVRLPEKTGE
jgi:FXSXX-COOH protein